MKNCASARLIISVLALLLFITACRRDSGVDNALRETPFDTATTNKITRWIDAQRSDSDSRKNEQLLSLKNNLVFKNTRYEFLRDQYRFIIVPLSKEFATKNNKDKNPINALLLIVDGQGEIKRGNIVQYISEKNKTTNNIIPASSFTKVFNSQQIDGSAIFSFLSITDEPLYELCYANGGLKSYSRPQTKQKTAGKTEGSTVLMCYDVYWVTFFEDGSSNWNYMYSYCQDDCNETREALGRSFSINCGGGGNTPPDCCIPDPTIGINSNSISETISDNCGLESTNPSTGNLTKSCTHTWAFNTVHLLFYTWKYISNEEAELEKESGVWKFKSVSHSGMDMSGTIPPCVSHSCAITTATPSISADKRYAQMNLLYTETSNVTCCPWCSPSYSTNSATSFWNAP